jgi:hypothetical protein
VPEGEQEWSQADWKLGTASDGNEHPRTRSKQSRWLSADCLALMGVGWRCVFSDGAKGSEIIVLHIRGTTVRDPDGAHRSCGTARCR